MTQGHGCTSTARTFTRTTVTSMRVAVPREVRPGERRVAATPDTVSRMVTAGLEVAVHSGAGTFASMDDDSFARAGASITAHDPIAESDVVLHVSPLAPEQIAHLTGGAITLGFLSPFSNADGINALKAAGATSFAVELVPRISRAQSMDALTSQALVSGYRAALVAAELLPTFMPLLMTAAGTIPPAKVLVLGAGVAGLQAIATAKRLGAVVEAYDVRAASADEVKSVGGKFIHLDLEALEGAGGYAREMGEARAQRQRELLTPYVSAADAVITTAAVPGRTAPLLVTREMVETMHEGAVVVDLAAESGGNVEGVVAGQTVTIGNAVVWGGKDVPSDMPVDASRLFARNVLDLLLLMTNDGEVTPDWTDEIVDACWATRDGLSREGIVT